MGNRFIITNANVLTMDETHPYAQALAVENGRIIRVGSDTDMGNLAKQGWEILNLKGKTVLPGLIDTHSHMMLSGLQATAVHLDDVRSIDQILDRIYETSRTFKDGQWVRGSYLNEQHLTEKRMPDRKELDRVCPHLPVFILHATCHLCSLNTKALETLEVPKGLEGLDMVAGEPSGVIRDPGILTFIHPKISRIIPESVKIDALKQVAQMVMEKGITTVHALDGGELGPGETKIIYRNKDKLHIQVVCYNQSMDLSEVQEMNLPRIGGCICADGAFEAHTAALFEPYEDEADNYGTLTYSQETMDSFIREANRAGLQIAVHCESERSIEQVLWAMEKALRDFPRKDARHRIEHFELPTENQIRRLAKYGIIASMQPAFIPAFIGSEEMETYGRLLGKSRLRMVHPYRTILDNGVPITGGSDSPVTPYDPLAGIQAAVNHPNEKQRVNRMEALAMFTKTAAWSTFEEEEKGAIKTGKSADLTVLEADPIAVGNNEIAAIGTDMVIIRGRRYNVNQQTV